MTDNIRLVQLTHPQYGRKVALVQEPSLVLLRDSDSVYALASSAIGGREKLDALIASQLSGDLVDYTDVYEGRSFWKLLPCFDYPQNPAACIVSGTGLTHKNSALNRQMMHQAETATLTDSMQMYQWGVAGGHPEPGTVGAQPEWFYKGTADLLRAHGDDLEIPCFGNDGGEEPEVAGVYIIDKTGTPWRIGFTTGNEFSDHVMEKKNYLYLAPSKLRNCSIGPELIIRKDFESIHGTVRIIRDGNIIWSSEIRSGEKNMAHSLSNLEHHHFKYPGHRIPLQAHIHFFGADAFSFGNQVKLSEGDEMTVQWEGFGRALKNRLKISTEKEELQRVEPMI